MKLYGTSKSRAARSILAAEELGVNYEHVPLVPKPGTDDRKTLDRINPNGHIPVLDDDGLFVWESMAINLYLGDKVGGPLWPDRAAERALLYQWSVWVLTEIDRPDWNQTRRAGDDAAIAQAIAATIDALAIVDQALQQQDYLLGNDFSLADLNVAGALSQPNENGKIGWMKLDAYEHGLPGLGDWLARCVERDSWRRVADFP